MVKDILVGVIVVGAVGLITEVWRRVTAVFSKQDPRRRMTFLYTSVGLWLLANLVAWGLSSRGIVAFRFVLVVAVSSVALLYHMFREIAQYHSVGLTGADQHTTEGVNYARSLCLVRNQLSFLGIGASKLTALSREFEQALERCRKDKPIRFILLRPTSESLARAARQFNKQEDTYKKRVLWSLRRIAELRQGRNFNIEVRFYPEPREEAPPPVPVFRMMFIDESVCLFSYNVLGEGDGSQLPQLHFVAARDEETASHSFYYAMERYYEWLWEQADPWDFREFLHDD